MNRFVNDHVHLGDKPLSKGRLSEVYVAKDFRRIEPVVVKIYRYSGLYLKEAMAMWDSEVGALKNLTHPSVIHLLEHFANGEILYLIFDYIPNKYTLAELILKVEAGEVEAPNLTWRIKQLLNLLGALDAIHDQGTFHRDVNPTNILVTDTPDRDLVLIDFGIAFVAQNMSHDDPASHYFTFPYVAPEKHYDGLSTLEGDIYLFGLTAISLLTFTSLKSELTPNSITDILKPFKAELKNTKLYEALEQLLKNLTKKDSHARPSLREAEGVLNSLLDRVVFKPKLGLHLSYTANQRLAAEGINTEALFADLNAQPYGRLQEDDSFLLLGASIRCLLRESDDGTYWQIVEAYKARPTKLQRERKLAAPLPFELEPGKYFSEAFEKHVTHNRNQEQNALFKKNERRQLFSTAEFMLKKLEAWDTTISLNYRVVEEAKPKRRKNSNKNRKAKFAQAFSVEILGVKATSRSNEAEEVEDVLVRAILESGAALYHEGKYVGQPTHYDVVTSILEVHPKGTITLPSTGMLQFFNIASRTSLKRQKDALKRFVDGTAGDAKLIAQLLNPSLATTTREKRVELIQKLEPSTSVLQMVERIVNAEDIFLLQGPPGTGKTTMIAEVVTQLLGLNPKQHILVTSQSNIAVDNALERIEDLRDKQGSKWSIVRDSRPNTGERNIFFDPTYKRFVDEVVARSSASEEKRANDAETPFAKTHEILERWRGSLLAAHDLRDAFLGSVNVNGATCIRVPELQRKRDQQPFDWVIIDEAAKTLDSEILVPLVHAKKLVLVGDQAQLKPFIDTRMEEALREANIDDYDISLFERIITQAPRDNRESLSTQFRMHPSIGSFVGNLFYANIGGLKSGVTHEERPIVVPELSGKDRVFWQDVRGAEVKQRLSYFNSAEVDAVSQLLSLINSAASEHGLTYEIAVITPYRAQVRRLDQMTNYRRSTLSNLKVEVATVDSFQGREVDITLYSLVRTKAWGLKFPAKEDRLNVSFSRSRLALVIVGDHRNAANNPLLKSARDLAKPFTKTG